jgi:hypothetical protein
LRRRTVFAEAEINITAREGQLKAIDQLAARSGLTRSAYMVQSALNRFGLSGQKMRRRPVSILKRSAQSKRRKSAK